MGPKASEPHIMSLPVLGFRSRNPVSTSLQGALVLAIIPHRTPSQMCQIVIHRYYQYCIINGTPLFGNPFWDHISFLNFGHDILCVYFFHANRRYIRAACMQTLTCCIFSKFIILFPFLHKTWHTVWRCNISRGQKFFFLTKSAVHC